MLNCYTRCLVLLFALGSISPAVMATGSSQEAPSASMANDPSLEWGPCPDLFPQGCEIAVLHGDPARSNADIFFKVPGGYEIPHHWHTSAERMVLVSGSMSVTYDGHDSVNLEAGEYAYGPAELRHKGSCEQGDDCVLFIAFEEPVDVHPAK